MSVQGVDKRTAQVAEQLLLIEREMRTLGLWGEEPPSPEALASREPFCVDTLSFEQWLQWVFLVRMKVIVESGAALPTASGILEMAEVVYRDDTKQMSSLLKVLRQFDRLIAGVSQ